MIHSFTDLGVVALGRRDVALRTRTILSYDNQETGQEAHRRAQDETREALDPGADRGDR